MTAEVRRAALTAVTLVGSSLVLVVGTPEPVQATLKICNHTASALDVAIAHGVKDGAGTSTGGHRGVTAEGWWEVAPNACAQVSKVDAGSHWLYYRATWKGGSSDGRSLLCIQKKAFTLAQQFRREGDRCPAGQYLAAFKRVEATKKNHTLNLK